MGDLFRERWGDRLGQIHRKRSHSIDGEGWGKRIRGSERRKHRCIQEKLSGKAAVLGFPLHDQRAAELPVYVTTVLEGLLLSLLLFIIAFITIIILQMRDRRNPLLWRGAPNP